MTTKPGDFVTWSEGDEERSGIVIGRMIREGDATGEYAVARLAATDVVVLHEPEGAAATAATAATGATADAAAAAAANARGDAELQGLRAQLEAARNAEAEDIRRQLADLGQRADERAAAEAAGNAGATPPAPPPAAWPPQ